MFAPCHACGNAMYVGAGGEESPPPCPHCGARPKVASIAAWHSAPLRDFTPDLDPPRRPELARAVPAPTPRTDYSEAEVLSQLAAYKARAGLGPGDRIVCEIALWMGLALTAAAVAAGYFAWDVMHRRQEVEGVMSTRTVVVGRAYNDIYVRVKYQDTLRYTVRGKNYERTWAVSESEIRDRPVKVYYFPDQPEQGTTQDKLPMYPWVGGVCLLVGVPLIGVGVYGRSRRPAGAADRAGFDHGA